MSRKIEIKILSEMEIKKEIKRMSDRVMSGLVFNKNTVVMTPEVFAQIFSQKRLELLEFLRKTGAISVSELARSLNRRFEVVYRDLKKFESYGFVRLIKQKRTVVPELVGELVVKIAAVHG